jgi:outer membrane biosynthesis protein TonB
MHKVNPTYPNDAKEEGAQGIFLLAVTIDEKGHISAAEVVVSTPAIDYDGDLLEKRGAPGALAGDERLARAAIEAVRQWRYEPVLDEDGKPTVVDAILTVKFALS